jgi:hypothetical protein
MRGVRQRLNAMIETAGLGAVDIDYRDDPRLVVLYGEQVFEFDPPALIDQGQRRMLNNCPDFAAESRQLSDAAAEHWRDAFAQRFIGRGDDDGDEASIDDDIDDFDDDDDFDDEEPK